MQLGLKSDLKGQPALASVHVQTDYGFLSLSDLFALFQ